MSDVAIRLAIVVAIVVAAAVVAWIVGRFRNPPHPEVTVGDVGDRPGVVLFTSTTCSTCKTTIAELEALGVRFREVTDELEPQRFEAWGVTAVPLTVVVDADGRVVRTISGVPRKRPLLRALAEAGVRS